MIVRFNQVHAANLLVGADGWRRPANCKTAFAPINHERDIVGHMFGHICHRTDIVSEALSLHQLNVKKAAS